jgi:hypothetical protein
MNRRVKIAASAVVVLLVLTFGTSGWCAELGGPGQPECKENCCRTPGNECPNVPGGGEPWNLYGGGDKAQPRCRFVDRCGPCVDGGDEDVICAGRCTGKACVMGGMYKNCCMVQGAAVPGASLTGEQGSCSSGRCKGQAVCVRSRDGSCPAEAKLHEQRGDCWKVSAPVPVEPPTPNRKEEVSEEPEDIESSPAPRKVKRDPQRRQPKEKHLNVVVGNSFGYRKRLFKATDFWGRGNFAVALPSTVTNWKPGSIFSNWSADEAKSVELFQVQLETEWRPELYDDILIGKLGIGAHYKIESGSWPFGSNSAASSFGVHAPVGLSIRWADKGRWVPKGIDFEAVMSWSFDRRYNDIDIYPLVSIVVFED